MTQCPLRILQVNTRDIGGGAAKVAWELFRAYRQQGHASWLAVGQKQSDDPGILPIEHAAYRDPWVRACFRLEGTLSPLVGKVRGAGRFRKWLHWWVAQPRRKLDIQRGREDFDYPATWRLLDLPPERPDILHLHNLHGGYFDLQALSWLSRQVPVILTLHDGWLLSGHCAHSMGCERWKAGCGSCPDLTIYPAIPRDATAYNWRRKRVLFSESRLFVATPSRWLMEKVEQSMLAPAVVESRVIHNGVDVSVFRPANKLQVRAELGLPQTSRVLLFVAHGIRQNRWKDYETVRRTIGRVAELLPDRRIVFVGLGEDAPAERMGRAEVRFVPYQTDATVVASYYQAADLYLHATKSDNFPNTILEALACGTPVVATAVGGIPEQVVPFQTAHTSLQPDGCDKSTGALLAQGDVEALSESVRMLLLNDKLHQALSRNACRSAHLRFDLKSQAGEYLSWYRDINSSSNQ